MGLCFLAQEVSVREHIPLEQGLRQPHDRMTDNTAISQRAYSIRTRIKTCTSDTANS